MRQLYRSNWLIALFALLSLFNSKSYANVADIDLQHLSVQDGLSQSSVLDIIQDKNGYIWVATINGLNRFNGSEFKQYTPRMPEGKQFPIEMFRKLFIDSNDNLWFTTLGAIGKYLPEKDEFQVYSAKNSNIGTNNFWAIGETLQGQLLFSGDKFLYQYNPEQDDFTKVEFNNAVELNDIVRTIYVEQDIIWLGTEGNGIFGLDPKTNNLYSLNDENPWNINLDARTVFDIIKIDQQYWLGTMQGAIVLNEDYQLEMQLDAFRQDNLQIVSNVVRSIIEEDNKIWLATTNGISIFDPAAESVFSISKENGHYVGLSNPFIIKAYKDQNNSIWFGTHTSGLFQYHESFSIIKHFKVIDAKSLSSINNSVWAFADNGNDAIWIAALSGGISLYNTKNGEFERFLQGSTNLVWDLEVDAKKRLWLATDTGIHIYAHNNGTLTHIKTLFDGIPITELQPMNGQFWIKNGEERFFKVNATDLQQPSSEISFKSLKSQVIAPLLFDSQNNIWLKTDSGIVVTDENYLNFKNILLQNNLDEAQPVVFNIHETDDAFWASTGKHGIFKLDKQTYAPIEQIHPRGYNVRGLTVNSVLDTQDQTSVWQGSQSEIWQISLQTGKLLEFIPRKTLDFNDLNQGATLMTKEGLLFFGGTNGFHVFNREKLDNFNQKAQNINADFQSLSSFPAPKITGLRIHNKPVLVGGKNSPLIVPIELTNTISLSYQDIPFSIEFDHINSLHEDKLNYRYRLLGWRDTWIETGNDDSKSQFASFSIETYGNHVFEVQGRIDEGPWSESATLNIAISPPFWLDTPAMLLYGMSAILVLLLMLRQYKRKLAVQNAIKESEERLKLTLWSSGDELWDWDVYRGQVYRANTWGTMDFPQDGIRSNSSYQANIHPNDMLRVQEALQTHIDKKSDFFQVTYRARTFNGEWVWILDRGMIVKRDNNDQPIRMTGTLKNISHLKQAEEQLKLYERSIETISDGVFIADTTFRFISVNQSYCEYTGETREQGLASYLKFNQYPEAFTEEVKKALRQKGNWNGEVESRRANGERYEMELNVDAIHGEDGKTTHYVGVFSDITSRKSTEKELLKLANTDPLTEMPNRSFFQASHNNLVRKDVPHALVCLDMDNFKKINDSLGHQTGDILIKHIGKRLQKITGTNATCYRLGGDEFSILVDREEDMQRINHYAQRILDQMAHPFLINKQEFVLGASVGIAFYPEDGTSTQELLKNADTAMYFAKNAGGNKYQFFSGEMNQNAVRQLQIENLIRYGLKDDLFTVFYQPKVDISSGKLVSMEALVRFEHPEKGIVSPAQFIPLAEETGQIIDIGEQVLRKACEDTKRWVSQGLFTGRVAVNISARQFELPDLDDRISRILQKVGLSPLHLECEITEGTLMQNPDQALQMMQRLREKGIHLALDDFGTGYSSLAYLKKFPLNTLKIDKAFIDDIATSSVDKHMTAAIINIAHNLGLKVVAEGVEQEKQLEILRLYDCEMLQGYLYSKPLNSTKFERLLTENLHISQLIGAN